MLRHMAMCIILVLSACGMAVAGVERVDDGVIVTSPGGTLKVQVVSDDIIRVLYAPGKEIPEINSLVVVDAPGSGAEWNLTETGGAAVIATERVTAEISADTGAITFRDADGNIVLREREGGGRTATSAEVAGENVFNVRQDFTLSPGEALYGLGQYQDGVMNWRGHEIMIAQSNTISTVPFLLSTAGYGILWDNYSLSKFHDGGDGMHFWSEVADAIDYYFVYGPSPDEVIAGYRELTGDAPMFPKWAYGFFQSKEKYNTSDEVLDIVKEYRRRQLPLDVIVQDWWYWGKYGWSAMKFDEERWPDPAATIDELHNRYNAHIMISIWPKFEDISEIYKDMRARGFIYEIPGDMQYGTYDAYNPEARDLYWKFVDEGIFSKGMDAWWMDATEPEIASAKTQESTVEKIKEAGKCSLGTTSRYLNAFSLMSSQGVYENQRNTTEDKRVFILTRSGFAGQQRNAAVTWSGDIEAEWGVLRDQISAGLNFCMAGVPYWTTDIGAFHVRYALGCENDEYRELYVRWFQFGTFNPIFRSHGTSTPREIWRFGEKGEWAYDSLEKFDRLRYRLLPYIYSLAWKVTNEGYTMMRGLAFDFAADEKVLGIDDQFMFGPAFLVNPITRPMYHREKLNAGSKLLKQEKTTMLLPIQTDWKIKNRKVYLPAGAEWYDFWSGEKFQGGQALDVPSPIDMLPLFVRAGSIVPMGPDMQYATEKPADPIELRVYPGADAEFTIYEDENDNYNYEKGVYATIPITWDDARRTLTIGDRYGSFPGMPETRTFEIVLVRPGHGVGGDIEPSAEKTITYSGKKVTAQF